MWCANGHRLERGKILLAVMALGMTIGAVLMNPPSSSGEPPPPEKELPSGPSTQVIPSLDISERYDTNVFYVGQGENLVDYVTTLNPKLKIEHKNQYVAGNVYGGVTGEMYVKNPGLNYVAPNGGFAANLDGAVARIAPKAKLTVRDDFMYTPRPPSFLAPETGNIAPEAFVRGIQTTRANSFSNMGIADGSYALSEATLYRAIYAHQMIRFGTQFANPAFGNFFDTTFQTINTGPESQISSRDLVSLMYQYQRADFSGGGFNGFFDTHGAIARWKRNLTKTFTADLSVGATVLQPDSSLQYIGSAKLEWKFERTAATAGYSRAVVPSFFISGLPLLSEVWSGIVSHQFSDNMLMLAGVDYANNRSVPSSFLIFKTFTARTSLDYTLTRWATISPSYSYGDFQYTLGTLEASFDRHQVMLTLRLVWR